MKPRALYQREVGRRLWRPPGPVTVVTPADLAHLPAAVSKYLQAVGVVGREKISNFRAVFQGEIRRRRDAGWLPFTADQHSFFGSERARLFLLRASQFGIPFEALHLYLGESATMQVTLASLFRIIDARGDEMNQSETVTMFNDMCVLAPATLIDPSIRWQKVDPLTVVGTFTNAGNTISATLSFNASGELVNFASDDRYLSSDGKRYERYRWSTPVGGYRAFSDGRLASRGEACWHLPEGDFVYVRLKILSVDGNVWR